MSKYTMALIGLDKNFNMVGLIKYTNLQWRRKYLQAGTFAVEMTTDSYDSSIVYLYCKDRPEVGKIEQVNYRVNDAGYAYIYVSGAFLEEELNRMVVHPAGESVISGAGSFTSVTGPVENVAFTYFNKFKTLTAGSVTSTLPIAAGTNQQRGKNVTVERGEGAYLGDKIYEILALDDMSYRVEYDFVNNTKTFKCYKGKDLTQDNTDGNNPVTFSTRYGNCKNPDVLYAVKSYRNAAIAINDATLRVSSGGNTESVKKTYVIANWQRAAGEGINDDRFVIIKPGLNLNDYKDNDSDVNGNVNKFLAAVLAESKNRLATDYPITVNVDFTAIPGSFDYMTDFNLGDLCSIEIPEIKLSADARLIGVQEVYKSGGQTLKLEFGTPVLI